MTHNPALFLFYIAVISNAADLTAQRYLKSPFEEIRNEVIDLKDIADLLNAPVVSSHNDLLSGNLMLNGKEEKLYFIDFEYGSYSYRGYDIANHFNEYVGYECDFTLYPNKDMQYHFFINYLQADAAHKAKMSPIDFDYLSVTSPLATMKTRNARIPVWPWQGEYLSGSSIH